MDSGEPDYRLEAAAPAEERGSASGAEQRIGARPTATGAPRGEGDCALLADKLITHTWLEAGGEIVIGGEAAEGFSTLAVY